LGGCGAGARTVLAVESGKGARGSAAFGCAGANPALAAEEVQHHERRVRVRTDVRVFRVQLAERGLELAGLHDEVAGQRQEGDVPLLDSDAALAVAGHEEVRAGVRIDDGLQGDLGFLELEARLVVDRVVADEAQSVSDHGDAGVEDVAGLRGGGLGGRRGGHKTQEEELCEKEEGNGRAAAWIFLQRNLLLVA